MCADGYRPHTSEYTYIYTHCFFLLLHWPVFLPPPDGLLFFFELVGGCGPKYVAVWVQEKQSGGKNICYKKEKQKRKLQCGVASGVRKQQGRPSEISPTLIRYRGPSRTGGCLRGVKTASVPYDPWCWKSLSSLIFLQPSAIITGFYTAGGKQEEQSAGAGEEGRKNKRAHYNTTEARTEQETAVRPMLIKKKT